MNVDLFIVCHVFGGILEGNLESGIRNAEIFQILTCYSIPFFFVQNHFAFTILFSCLTFNYRILSRKSQKSS